MKDDLFRQNSFNFLRLIFATFVIIQHTFILTGVDNKYVFSKNGNFAIGTIGIWGFFAISGFLLSKTISTQAIKPFLFRRFFRIYPAFWVCLFMTSLIASLTHDKEIWPSIRNSLEYMMFNSSAYIFRKVPNHLESQELLGSSLNGSLWSLFPEVFTYLVFAVFWAIFKGTQKQKYILIYFSLFLLSGLIWWNSEVDFTLQKNFIYQLFPLFLAFGTGVLMQLHFANKRKISPKVGVLIFVIFIFTLKFGGLRPFGVILFSIFVIFLGQSLRKGWMAELGRKNDISFGLYLYHWPVLQVLTLYSTNFNHQSIYLKITVLWIITCLLAWGSWSFVEKKMIDFSRRLS